MSVISKLLCGMVRAYQLVVSPIFPPSCRFYPSCSEYALQALDRHGPLAGIWLTIVRLARCHPFGGSGYDPVPESLPRPAEVACARELSPRGAKE